MQKYVIALYIRLSIEDYKYDIPSLTTPLRHTRPTGRHISSLTSSVGAIMRSSTSSTASFGIC